MDNARDGRIGEAEAPAGQGPEEILDDRYLRLSADLQNLRRRAEIERAELLRFGVEPLSRSLLPVLDNLRRGLDAAAPTDPLVVGLRQVLRQFEEVLAAQGVVPVETVGQPFDPGRHEAVLTDERPDLDEDTVTTELRPGYRLHERVLRPAQVVVSRRPANGERATGQDATGDGTGVSDREP
ncbi:MAG TPA: nucleotide exchange factor GrpE [Candidatus Dormibacteraeota bacterium]|jgi:molecular chaperone GrpE